MDPRIAPLSIDQKRSYYNALHADLVKAHPVLRRCPQKAADQILRTVKVLAGEWIDYLGCDTATAYCLGIQEIFTGAYMCTGMKRHRVRRILDHKFKMSTGVKVAA